MLLTKHCSPEVRDLMRNGHFKIGSHKEYSNGLQTGALSDTAEGIGGFTVKGDLIDFTGTIGTARLKNVSFINANNALQYNSSINSMIFCVSKGQYDPHRHASIISGDSALSYQPNPTYTSFITLDAKKLLVALTAATDQYFCVRTRWIGTPVHYGIRYKTFDGKIFKGMADQERMLSFLEQASLKPEKFVVEQEYRFLMETLPKRIVPKAIFTKDLSVKVRNAFRKSIIDYGDS